MFAGTGERNAASGERKGGAAEGLKRKLEGSEA
jgi:hypothetical protein